jgi:hypothetical protein
LRAAAESTNAFAFILLRRRGINAGRAGSGESKKSAAACNRLTERAAPRALSRERRRCSAWPLRWRRTTISSVRRWSRLRSTGTSCFTLGFPKIEHLVAARGRMSPERRCEYAFDVRAVFARELHRGRDRLTSQWHLDEMAVTLASRQFWLWRAADGEGEVLDLCSNDAGTQIGSEGSVKRTQIGRAQSGGPGSGLGSGGGFPCPERFVSYDAERVAGCEMTLDVEGLKTAA